MLNYVSAPIEYSSGFSMEFGRRKPKSERGAKRTTYKLAKKAPTGFNGVHRRRNKHWSW